MQRQNKIDSIFAIKNCTTKMCPSRVYKYRDVWGLTLYKYILLINSATKIDSIVMSYTIVNGV